MAARSIGWLNAEVEALISERIDPRARVSVAPIRTDPFRRGTVLICAKLSFVRYVVLRALDRVVSN